MCFHEWQPILVFESRGTADAVATILESEDVPTQVYAGRLALGLDADFALAVPVSLVHRARWVLKASEFDDAELTYLATGELPEEE